jgi:hypothetical protein
LVSKQRIAISPAEFDEVAAELGRTLAFFKVSDQEKKEVLGASAAHKGEAIAGYLAASRKAVEGFCSTRLRWSAVTERAASRVACCQHPSVRDGP